MGLFDGYRPPPFSIVSEGAASSKFNGNAACVLHNPKGNIENPIGVFSGRAAENSAV